MRIDQLSGVRHYLSTNPMLGVPAVSNLMTCGTFKVIMGKIQSNKTMLLKDDPHYDKLHKVKLLIDDLNWSIKKYTIFKYYISW